MIRFLFVAILALTLPCVLQAQTVGTNGGVAVLPKSTFANLPTCNASNEGRQYALTDSNSVVFNAAAAGGGANHVIGYCNGTSWLVH